MFFKRKLNCVYLGDWHDRENSRNIEPQYLRAWLTAQGVDAVLIEKAIRHLDATASLGEGKR